MDIRERVCSVLEPLNIAVAKQGSFANTDIPDRVITYWVVTSPDIRRYNGKITTTAPRVQIAFYARDPAELYTIPDSISGLLMNAGFLRQGNWRDTAYEKGSGHYGKMTDFIFLERG